MPKKMLLALSGLLLGVLLLSCLHYNAPVPDTPEQPVTRSAELGLILLDENNGLFVLAVTEDSPASRAGFRPGDLLLQSGDIHLTTSTQLEKMLHTQQDTLSILLERNGLRLHLNLPTRKDLANGRGFHYTNLKNGGGQP